MYNRILVALDGSEVAERVLPYVEALVEKFRSSVTLIQVTDSVGTVAAELSTGADMPVIDPTPIVRAEHEGAAEYLQAIAARLSREGLVAGIEQPEGSPAHVVVERAESLGADLIAMTTHGRGGLGRLVFGSVADRVLRHAPCPVLLVRVSEHQQDEAETTT